MQYDKHTPPHELLEYIASDNGKLFKEAVIKNLADINHEEFFSGIRLALDNFDTFGVKKVPVHPGPDGPGLKMSTFKGLCEQLIDRDLTGDDAKMHIEMTMRYATVDQWNGWYRRILMKKLDAGFSEATVNKAVKTMNPEYIVPVFSCQLAHDSKDHESKLVGKKFIDVKLDGARVLTFVHPDGRVFQTSRNGKELENFPKIVKQFQGIAHKLDVPYVFDGEMMSSSFQDLMRQFKRKTDVNTEDAIYYVFDALPLSEFRKGISEKQQAPRSAWVQQFLDAHESNLTNAAAVALELVDLDTPEGKARFQQINIKAIEGGYEGIMIKDPNGYYECKRTYAWMKKKPTIDITMTIESVEEGKPDSKYVGMLGALVCVGFDSLNRLVRVNCGGGFSDAERKDLWARKDELPGCLVDVEADAVTQNSDGEYSLRFPRKKTFRGFEPGEQI